ncbi:MAG: heme exporter protein CcmB [Gemmatimonadaceae bacterium]
MTIASRPAVRVPGFLADSWRIARKDLLIEFRTRSAFLAAAVFAVLSVAIFRFTWDATAVPAIDLAPPVLWVIFTFSGLLGLNRSFGVELADRAMDAMLASPMSREAVFAGKALANLVFVALVQALTIPAIALFFDLPAGAWWWSVVGVAVLAMIGLTAVGTLFAAVASNTRLAEMLLPMLALPFFVPVVIPAAQATALLLAGRPVSDVASWIKMLVAFDLVFVAACTVAFPYTLDE